MMQTALITTLLAVSSVSCVSAGGRDLVEWMADATCTLGLKVHQKLRNQPNLVHSPIGLHSTLSLALQGARGATETELLQLLNWGEGARTPNYLNNFYMEFLRQTSSEQNTGRVGLVSALLARQNISIDPGFLNQAKNVYQAQVISQDPKNPDSDENEINEFVANRTEGIIQTIIPRSSTASKSSLVLASALSFKGLWQLKFDPNRTQKQTFFKNDGTISQVDMMKDTRVVLHKKDNQFGIDIVEIPVAGDKFALVVTIPQQKNGLNTLEDLLRDTKRMESLLLGMSPKTVELTLPKFKIETKLDLKDALKQLGMVKASTPNMADFSGILEPEGGRRSTMFQRSVTPSLQNFPGVNKDVRYQAGLGIPLPSSTEDGRSSTTMRGSLISSTPGSQVVIKDAQGPSVSGVSVDTSPDSLYISNVYHSSTIEINESGLMPESSTNTQLQDTRNQTSPLNSSTASAQVRVVADRPFLFVLRKLDSIPWLLMIGRFSAN